MGIREREGIRAIEELVEQLREELNGAIAEYDDALEHPEHYDVELARSVMERAQRLYDDALDELEVEIAWSQW